MSKISEIQCKKNRRFFHSRSKRYRHLIQGFWTVAIDNFGHKSVQKIR